MEALEDKIKKFLAVDVGDGDGSGSGSGSGYVSGSGDGYGSGCGSGCGSGIKVFNGDNVYLVDNILTIFISIRGNVAKGYILQSDLQ